MTARIRSVLGAAAALLVALAFAPAIESCGDPLYPYQEPAAWPPHIFALSVLLFVLVLKPWSAWTAIVVTLLGAAALGYLTTFWAIDETEWLSIGLAVGWWALTVVAWPVFRRAVPIHRRALFAVRFGGVMCLYWYGWWLAAAELDDGGGDGAYWGIYGTTLCSLLIIVSAHLALRRGRDGIHLGR